MPSEREILVSHYYGYVYERDGKDDLETYKAKREVMQKLFNVGGKMLSDKKKEEARLKWIAYIGDEREANRYLAAR